MPEKVKAASFTLHFEPDSSLAQLSEDTYDDNCSSNYEEEEEGEQAYMSEDDIFDNDNLPDLAEVLGFRITGGSDFFMPITIFHVSRSVIITLLSVLLKSEQVRESSRAEKANLKLGDAILAINGKSTEEMTLVRANRYLSKVADADVKLLVAK